MKRLLIAASALATIAAPIAASAQGYGEVRRDQREVRQDQRELDRQREKARRDGVVTNREQRAIQDDRRDLRDSQQELQGDRRDYRQTHRFDRNNPNWYRGHSHFNGYNGRRAGYWFAPGYGYRPVDRRYYGYRWARGGFVPYGYRSFYVQDPYMYGLRAAPYGHRWVYVDNNLVLMALATGLIADIVYNAY